MGMHVGHLWGVKGDKCSSGYALNDKFSNGEQLMQVEKYAGGGPNCSTNSRPGSIISYNYKTKIETRSCISLVNDGISEVPSLKSITALFPSSVQGDNN